MGHATRSELRDLEALFKIIRTWEGIRETSYGVFYIKRLPFLHFHTKDGARWADVRQGIPWGPHVAIPHKASAAARARFLKTMRARHRATLAAT